MYADFFFFLASMLLCGSIAYIVAMLWFCNPHTRQLKSFIGFGIGSFLWTFFSAIADIVPDSYFRLFYTLHSVTSCIFPYLLLWFTLNFGGFKLADKPRTRHVICLFALAEVLFAATNPWHSTMYSGLVRTELVVGKFFWVHASISYAFSFASLFCIFVHVIRFVRKAPMLLLVAFSMLLPIVVNLMLALGGLDNSRDWTPMCFFFTFAAFFFSSYRSGMFSLKSLALMNIFSSLPDVILITNSAGVIVDGNEAFRKTFPEAPVVIGSTRLSDFSVWLSGQATECRPPTLFDRLDNLETRHKGGEFSLPMPGGQGELRSYTLRRDYIRHDKKNISGFVFTMSDVSRYRGMIEEIDRKNAHLTAMNALAEEASRTKSAFLANMSHEIRTPINAITGMATLARGTEDIGYIHSCLDKVQSASRQLLGIINDILDMSKIEANKMELAAEAFTLSSVIGNMKSMMDIRAAEKSQRLTFVIGDDLPNAVVGDELRLSQIFLNLLSNAVKFTPEGGEITFSMDLVEKAQDGSYTLSAQVKDNGIGMTEEQQGRLFKSFEQADRGTAKRFGGTGLGLAISKRIAMLMDGNIQVQSAPGEGSLFTVTFRLQPGSITQPSDEAEKTSFDFSGRVALLVEDIEINREIAMALLKSSGLEVDCAENGQVAVDMFMTDPGRYDIIFMDVHMPLMDGYAATETIRGVPNPYAKEVPIVAMTANAFAEDVVRCRAAGMNDHIAKPIDVAMLMQKTAQNLRR